jgi:hypothetical protein
MATNETRLVERLKETATRVGTQGVRMVVEGTVAALKAVDRLQELIPDRQRTIRVKREPARGEPVLERPVPAQPVRGSPAKAPRAQARATAERVLAEVHAVKTRLKAARPAPHPLKVGAEEETPTTARKTPRTSGRKTMAPATAPRHAKAKTAPVEGFKAKRGQKHRH